MHLVTQLKDHEFKKLNKRASNPVIMSFSSEELDSKSIDKTVSLPRLAGMQRESLQVGGAPPQPKKQQNSIIVVGKNSFFCPLFSNL
jgi:hypothetical protein